MAETLKIAVMGGDGTGPEVVREGLKVLQAVAQKEDFTYETEDFDYGGDRYLAAGGDPNEPTIPVITDKEVDELRAYDAIYLGAVGHPDVAPGILEKGLLLKRQPNVQNLSVFKVKWTRLVKSTVRQDNRLRQATRLSLA